MYYYIESPSVDAAFNLALEQYMFDMLPREHSYFMLWRNDNAVIIGRHQNTISEIDEEFIQSHGIKVVRRLSGGGAVYHDLGNLNYTFIVDRQDSRMGSLDTFCIPVTKMLKTLGVTAEINGRNDITLNGKKFSGNSQYTRENRIMHHGTILYDSDLQVMQKTLRVSKEKQQSKGVSSVHSRVTNIRPYVKDNISMTQFIECFRKFMFTDLELHEYQLTEADLEYVNAIKHKIYDCREWNFGSSLTFDRHKKCYVDGCGMIEIYMNIENGYIKDIHFYGDYFSQEGTEELEQRLLGSLVEEKNVLSRIQQVDLQKCFMGVASEIVAKIIVDNITRQ